MAFQELAFNYQLDPTLVQPPSGSSYTQAAGLGGLFGAGGGNSMAANPLNSAGVSGAPGNWFSNLFGAGADGSPGFFSRQSILGGTDANTGITTQGWAPIALGLGQAVMGGMQGRKAMSLAEDQFKEARRQFDLNFNTQRKTINTALEDRQRARVASNSSAYESVDSYMNRNRV